jgi:hypothetical protein
MSQKQRGTETLTQNTLRAKGGGSRTRGDFERFPGPQMPVTSIFHCIINNLHIQTQEPSANVKSQSGLTTEGESEPYEPDD